ncbi:MAG: chemotaxis protein CheA [Myxococcaceae bacterium]
MSTSDRPLADFVAEAVETAEALGRDLVRLDTAGEGEAPPAVLNAVFRHAHTLKGLAALYGQSTMADVAHAAEDLLDRLRLGRLRLREAVIDALSEAVEVLQRLAVASESGVDAALVSAAEALNVRLRQLSQAPERLSVDVLGRLELTAEVRAVLTEYEEHRLRETLRRRALVWRFAVRWALEDFDRRLPALVERLTPLAEVIATLPGHAVDDPTAICFELLIGSAAGEESLLAALAPDVGALSVVPFRKRRARVDLGQLAGRPATAAEAEAPLSTAEAEAPLSAAEAEATLRSSRRTVRVDIEKLDEMMNAVGELRLIAANLQRLADGATAPGVLQLPRAFGADLLKDQRQMARRLDALQSGLLEARMVPLAQVFERLQRLVRRVAREAGKELELLTRGGEVELDKLIVEELSDPLMHLLRNAIDHGIEAPKEREALAKPRRGRLTLTARPAGAHVVIEVRDDGRGVNTARVREVALERGLLAPHQATDISQRALHRLLFTPGFSTARSISPLSGRGVGLDVVHTNLARLSGVIDVESVAGLGTCFRLTLPLTLAMVRGLIVRVSGRTYAIPLNGVVEILALGPEAVQARHGRETISVRGTPMPLVRLSRLFRLPEVQLPKRNVVVVGLAQERLGLAVDELLGQADMVTKPLGERLSRVEGIAGVADLGNRRTVLVLDVAALMGEALGVEPGADRAALPE